VIQSFKNEQVKTETLNLVANAQASKSRAQLVVDDSNRNRAASEPVLTTRKVRHLDVDDVLRRSLPKVSE
jgi:hypothetical protein